MPQTLLLDSDILIDHLRKEQNSLDYIRQKIEDGSPLFISVIYMKMKNNRILLKTFTVNDQLGS